jgi:hypothetical protein
VLGGDVDRVDLVAEGRRAFDGAARAEIAAYVERQRARASVAELLAEEAPQASAALARQSA